MIRNCFLSFTLLILLASINGCYYDNEEELYPPGLGGPNCDTIAVSYSATVQPILESNCYECHSGTAPSAGIGLNSYSLVVPLANNGTLYGVIAHLNGFSPMPRNRSQLPQCEIDQIKSWIDAGALNN